MPETRTLRLQQAMASLVLDEDEFAQIVPELSALEVASARGAVDDVMRECRMYWRAHMNERIAAALAVRGWTVATAESCTGGLIGDTLTDRAGSSAYFMGGTYGVDGGPLGFRASFNTPANYRAYYDFNGDGLVETVDNLQFRNRFNRPLTWTT